MPIKENHINPCFCISIRAGSTIISIFDIIWGLVYILRFMYIEYLQKEFSEYFPEDIPNPTQSSFMFAMSRRGNFVVTIICGIVILLATTYLRYSYFWLAATCYAWITTKVLLIISFSIFCNALIESGQSHFKRFGYEILFNIFINLYFLLVVGAYIRETRIELNNYRAIKPINIARDEHEEYLRNDRESKFNNATSYHFMSPDFFLNANKTALQNCRVGYNLHDTHVDDTLLQYIAAGSKVEVDPEIGTEDSASGSEDINSKSNSSSQIVATRSNMSANAKGSSTVVIMKSETTMEQQL